MKTTTYEASTESAYGVKLPEKVEFKYDAVEFVSVEECKNAGEWLSDKDILKTVNDGRKNTARQAMQTEVLKGLGYEKPTLKTSDVLRLKTLYNVFISVEGTSVDEAKDKAMKSLNITEWPANAKV